MSQSEVICITAYGKYFTGVTPNGVCCTSHESDDEIWVLAKVKLFILLYIQRYLSPINCWEDTGKNSIEPPECES